ncbi:hypothetical protein BGX28_009756 [Mortierella sp. GBA30]|nr:hypothetical protein BGX28_009756 [Mortierella sp. GBA30]
MPALEALRALIVMGEVMPPSLHGLMRRVAPNSIVINEYGPTECSVATTVWKCPVDFSGDRVPIGRPLPNKTIYLLDTHGNPVPLGVNGEIYIGGVGVARGYLNHSDMTKERFIPDPFSGDSNARMYKTGDMARYLPDGNLVHLGRNDHQIKIRGFRIELGDIETRLIEHLLVSDAVVVAVGEDSNKRLVAYVVGRQENQLQHGLNASESSSSFQLASTLRSYLTKRLPEYMIPVAFVRMDMFPLTANGKLDRRALPMPDDSAFARQVYEEPRGSIEITLSNIWIVLLNVVKVGRHDNFFVLGGHSLMAMRMIGRIRTTLGFDMSLRTLFEAPTIAELAPRLLATRATQEESYDVLLPIKPQGARPPLFCVHPGIGLSWCFTGLSTRLDPDQPLYSLQARGFTGDGKMAATLDEMVLDYIDQIRRIQPHGPYHLLGYSFGGLVAHTMASYLEEQGEYVALVGLMDTPAGYHNRVRRALDEDEDSQNMDPVTRLVGDMDQYSMDLMKPFLNRTAMIRRNNSRIASAQAPRVINGDVLLFRATVLPKGIEKLWSSVDWKPYVLGTIEVYDIECEHFSMDLPEPIAVIGQVLSQKLNERRRQAQGEE